jgi:hypothetical protein
MTLAARELHRPAKKVHSFGLPADQVARILGRPCRRGQPHECTLDLRTDEIRCGTRRVWKTGARQVADYILTCVPERDLDCLERVDWDLWVDHCIRQLVYRNRMPKRGPEFYRRGRRYIPPWLPQAQRELETLVMGYHVAEEWAKEAAHG